MARSSAPTAFAGELASEIFVLGFPLLVMDAIRRAHPLAPSGFQRFPPGAQQIVPGLFWDEDDCCETSAAFDLTPTPAILDLPDPQDRFLSVTLFDAAGVPFAARAADGAAPARRTALTAPSWRGATGSGTPVLQAPSEWVWAVSRIVGRSAAERPQLEALASRQRLSPLAGGLVRPRPAPRLGVLDLVPLRHLAGQAPQHLLHRLGQLIERAPQSMQEQLGPALKARLARLTPQGAGGLDLEISQACVRGFADGCSRVLDAYEELLSGGGADWEPVGAISGVASSAAQQAALAFARIGAPLPQDILSLRCGADATGRVLTGAGQYRLVFEPGRTPPALWGWRLDAGRRRDLRTGGVIGDHSHLLRDPDGRIEVRVASEPPDGPATANWLRAPRGRFELTLRLFRPAPAALEGGWRMQRIECVAAGGVDRPAADRGKQRGAVDPSGRDPGRL